MNKFNSYKIQEWLFQYAEGKFEIDLAESGIQHHYINDLKIQDNYHLNYSVDQGDLKLRKTLAGFYEVSPDRVLISHGSQEALYLFYNTFLNSSDHVIVTQPGWQQAWEIPKQIGSEVSILKLNKSEQYRINLLELEGLIKTNTKLIILNSPNNPVGTEISLEEWKGIIQIARKHGIYILNDEEYITQYEKSLLSRYEKSIIVSSLSKVYGFPGLRLGWLISSLEIVNNATNLKRYITVCNSSLCEQLGIQVLENKNYYVERYLTMMKAGLTQFKKWLQDYPQLKLIPPQGTPYAYIELPETVNSQQFALDVLHQERVLVMPGEVFEDNHTIRLSFGRTKTVLEEGLKRIGRVLREKY